VVNSGAGPIRGVYILALVGSLVSGVLVAVQTRVNGEFGLALDNGILAAVFSFLVGLVIVAAIVLVHGPSRRGASIIWQGFRGGSLPWWTLLGGVAGAAVVLSQGVSAGVLGVALFSVALVSGQTLGAMAIDHKGLFGQAIVRLTLGRVIGAVIVLAGVVIALDLDASDLGRGALVLALPLLSGIGAGFQQAVNGRVRAVAGSAFSATLVNFVAGSGALAIALAISLPFMALPASLPGTWWLWTGGAVGVGLIWLQARAVSIIGVLALGVTMVTGQLLGSLALDIFAPVASSDIEVLTVLGTLITLVGAIVVAFARKAR